jgi:hypothetical protein
MEESAGINRMARAARGNCQIIDCAATELSGTPSSEFTDAEVVSLVDITLTILENSPDLQGPDVDVVRKFLESVLEIVSDQHHPRDA